MTAGSHFEIVGTIEQIEPIAAGESVRNRRRLGKQYGRARWRRLKGVGLVRLRDGRIRRAEIPWYEARGIGKRKFKIKRFLD